MRVDVGATPETAIATALLAHFGSVGQGEVRTYSPSDVIAADTEGLLGLLASAFTDGDVELDAPAVATLDTLLASAAREAVILESRAVATVSALRDAGVDTRILKGLAVGYLDHDTPGLRPFCDVDVLVHGREMPTAIDELRAVGFRRHFEEPFDGFDERIGKGVALGDDRGVVIDLHRTLALGFYGTRFPVDLLWHDADEFQLAGTTMCALNRPLRFLHCALHLALSPVAVMKDGFDLATITARDPALSTSTLIDLANEAGCGHPVARAITLATMWLGTSWAPDGLVDWARSRQPTTTERLMMAAYHGRWAGSRVRSTTALFGLRGADRRLAARGLFARDHQRAHE